MKVTAKQIRIKLHIFENELRKLSGSNKLVNQYLSKITYMQMWMRLIEINKATLKGWSMPDMNTVNEMRKKGIEELKKAVNKDE